MLERLQLPRFSLPFWSGGGGRGRARSASAAARLQARLPTLQRPPHRWRELLVHAMDLQQEINVLEPPPGLTGRWRKCKARVRGVLQDAGRGELTAALCRQFNTCCSACTSACSCRHGSLAHQGASSLNTLAHPPQESSDSMADAFEMVELPWLFRKAVAVLNVLEVGAQALGGGWGGRLRWAAAAWLLCEALAVLNVLEVGGRTAGGRPGRPLKWATAALAVSQGRGLAGGAGGGWPA